LQYCTTFLREELKKQMLNILLVSRDKTSMSALKAGLEENDVQTAWAESGSYGLSMIAERNFDLVVTDEILEDMTGLDFIKTVIAQKPMVNCAVVSSLLPDDFHEASEGLGILMQLPDRPGQYHAKKLLRHLQHIPNLAIVAT
jgi:CheY-like chemotaxis protein